MRDANSVNCYGTLDVKSGVFSFDSSMNLLEYVSTLDVKSGVFSFDSSMNLLEYVDFFCKMSILCRIFAPSLRIVGNAGERPMNVK